jgi:hypothetical protein
MFCAISVALLATLLLAMSPGRLTVSSPAHADSQVAVAVRPEQAPGNAVFAPVTPTTYYTSITPGAAMVVGGASILTPGVAVAAYRQGGAVHRTVSIQDGSYHFYNVPPGTYVVYAETWVAGSRKVASTVITVVADERNYGVTLDLQ